MGGVLYGDVLDGAELELGLDEVGVVLQDARELAGLVLGEGGCLAFCEQLAAAGVALLLLVGVIPGDVVDYARRHPI